MTCKPQDKRKLGRPKIIWRRKPLHELEDDKISSLINSKNRANSKEDWRNCEWPTLKEEKTGGIMLVMILVGLIGSEPPPPLRQLSNKFSWPLLINFSVNWNIDESVIFTMYGDGQRNTHTYITYLTYFIVC